VKFSDLRVNFIGRDELLRNKRVTARASDLADCERLGELE
jgi:hypothetical protein